MKFSVTFPEPESEFIDREAKLKGVSKASVVVRCVALEVERRRERASGAMKAIRDAAEMLSSARFKLSKATSLVEAQRARLSMVDRGANQIGSVSGVKSGADLDFEAAVRAWKAADAEAKKAEADVAKLIGRIAAEGLLHAEP